MTDDTEAPQGVEDVPTILESAAPETEELKLDNTTDDADPNEDGSDGEGDEEDEKSKAKKRRERANRARERLLVENATLKERLRAESAGRTEEKPAKPDGPPREEDFKDFFEYQRALARFEVMRELEPKLNEARSSATQLREQERFEQTAKSHNTRVESFAKITPDFHDVLSEAESDLEPGTPAYRTAQKIIVESDIGPQILYYLAKNPDVTDRLGRLDEVGVARELGRLEAKLTPPKGRTSTSAPPPIKTVKGSANMNTKDPSKMSMEEYRAYRGYK